MWKFKVRTWKKLWKVRAILCVLFGHPPVFSECFGEVSCARCDQRIGDALIGGFNQDSKVNIDHDSSCEYCEATKSRLRWRDRVLTKMRKW